MFKVNEVNRVILFGFRTEPYMEEFLKLDPKTDLQEAGFVVTEVDQASRSHRVYVARKPELVEAFV